MIQIMKWKRAMLSRCKNNDFPDILWSHINWTDFPFYSDLGAHIDGFIAVAAHTVVATVDRTAKVTGRKADTILAAYWAGQAALRLLKPGSGVS